MLYVSTVERKSFFFFLISRRSSKSRGCPSHYANRYFSSPTLYFPEMAHEIWKGSFVCLLVRLSVRPHAAHRLQEVTLKVEEAHRLSAVCVCARVSVCIEVVCTLPDSSSSLAAQACVSLLFFDAVTS